MQKDNTRKKIIISIFVFLFGLVLLVVYPVLTGKYWVSSDDTFMFEGVSGPIANTVIADPEPTKWQLYGKGASNRMAILLTDRNSAWLGLVHGLKTIGLPFRVTTDVDEALKHNVVLIYPIISGKVLSSNQLKQIANFARTGGKIIGVNVLGGGLNPIFGFKSVKPSRTQFRLNLHSDHALTNNLIDKDLQIIRLSTERVDDMAFGTHSYINPKHAPLAVYNDGTPAIVYNKFKNGEVFAIGFDIGFYILKAYNRRMENVSSTYANDFEASIDNLLLFLKSIYRHHEPNAVTLGTVPYNHSLSVMLTHDIDYNKSLKNALAYAEQEHDQGTSGTHFVQTKYIRDWNDKVFFDDEHIAHIKRLQAFKVELASHSVSHSQSFHQFEMGSGDEQYPDYTPFVKDRNTTYNSSILGELRVSKFLIDYFAPKANVVSFRPGHLSNPLTLPQALQATGYRYSSSVTANVSLSHLPFKLNHNRDISSELEVFEFPITVEDELPPKMGDRLNKAIELMHKIRRYGGIFVVLIHPDILDHKLAFQTALINAAKPYAWFGSLREFGDWWSARDKINLDIESTTEQIILKVDIPVATKGQVIEIPESWLLLDTQPKTVQAKQNKSNVILENAQGTIVLKFSKNIK